MNESPIRLAKFRRVLLFTALSLGLVLFALDRYAAFAHVPAADSTRVVIYTTQWCPYCKRLRADLAANHVPYSEIDVERTFQGQLGFWALRGRGVPVSAIGPKVVYGYRVNEIANALSALGYSFAASVGTPPDSNKDVATSSTRRHGL
jgi:glutaredoxin